MYEPGKRRRIEITDAGEKTVHFLKEPSDTDYLRYQRQMREIKSRGHSDQDIWDFGIEVYDFHVDRVEGYSWKNKPLMEEKPKNWKKLIPPRHKAFVALELLKWPVVISSAPAGRYL